MMASRKDVRDTEEMLARLAALLSGHHVLGNTEYNTPRCDAEQLRRISMTLHRWHEMECGVDGGCIERGHRVRKEPSVRVSEGGRHLFVSDENGKPYFANHNGARTTYTAVADRERGALKRLKAIMARYPSLTSYVQGDPRGAALYILRPGDVREGETADSCYSRGLAVYK